MKMISRGFIVLCILLAGCVPAPANPPVEPNASSWPTWVVTDVAAVRPAAPPDQAATQAELKEVQTLVAGRDQAALQQIAYWDSGSPSYRWIEIAFAQNRATPASAPRVFRMMSLLNVAIYDALVVAWDAKYTYQRARPAALAPSLPVVAQHTNSPSYPSEHAVAAGAASTVLAYIYPDLAQDFLAKAQAAADSRVLAGAHFPSDVEAGLELGRQVAQQVIARAQVDDTLPAWDGVIPTGPGHWTGEKPAEPNAAKWETWVLASPDAVRPGPPLAHDSPELAAELQEVMTITHTFPIDQKAMWWQSAEGVFENWYTFASLRMFEQGLDANPVAAARTYALMSVAQHDAVIACWDAKYTYWSFRPIHMEPTLKTVFATPNYPSYPSGHACVSTAISEVIAAEFPAYAEAIRARAADAYESRIWAGIHFRHEMVAGKEIGVAVAQQVLAWDD
ncbi:MAG: PA-phosphatase [Chloroflexi bacterium]|nr:MAG: PA-phosphatase [Chloroflexota bacterium]